MTRKEAEKFWIGRKILLHTVAFPQDSSEKDTFIPIEVVEIRAVKGVWGGQPEWGLRATDSERKEYFSNWVSFDDASANPMWCWYTNDSSLNSELYYDVTQGIGVNIDFRPVFLDKYSDIVGWCGKHFILYSQDSETKCPYCYSKLPPKQSAQSRSWVGWK